MNKITVFYDGACHLCHREIKHYAKLDQKQLLHLEDISQPDFIASNYGLNETKVNLHMHVLDEQGVVHQGLNSFIEIWKRIPRYQWLVPVASHFLLKSLLNLGYEIFARLIRPYLPKRKCQEGHCRV